VSALPSWLAELRDQLDERRGQDLLRQLTVTQPGGRVIERDGRTLINLSGNDYLALAQHPHLRRAAAQAIEQYGVGSGASRLISGHQPLHEQVEKSFAAFKHAEAALIFPTGYMANLAALSALARPGDLILLDKLNHASLIDAARATGAIVRIYPHRQVGKAQRLLAQRDRASRAFIVTDAVFSMDGDAADLPALCDLAEAHDAMLIVDEAHGTGVLGARGAGLCELQNVAQRVDVVISTASKALGGLGGIVTARQVVIDTLINHARSFIYTTAAPPAQVAAIGAALDVIRDEPWRRQRVLELARRVRGTLGLDDSGVVTPIVPVITGSAAAALALAQRLREAGFDAPAVRPPTVAPNAARVRLSLRADLEDEDVARLIALLSENRLNRS